MTFKHKLAHRLALLRSTIGAAALLAACEKPIPVTAPGGQGSVPVSAVMVNPGTATMSQGQRLQLTATPQDANGNSLSGRTITWASSNTGVAPVDGSGLVTGAAAGSVTIAATSEGHSGTAAVTVDPPPPPSGGAWPHEPAGLTVITDEPFNAVNENGWHYVAGNAAIVQDATAPASPPNVLEIHYPVGLVSGNAAGRVDFTPPQGLSEAYIGFWEKVSNPWIDAAGGINKIFFWEAPTVGSWWVLEHYGGPPNWQPRMEIGESGASEPVSDGYATHIATVNMPLGVWHQWEVYFKISSTPSSNDGLLKVWFDGTLVTDMNNVNYAGTLQNFQLCGTWGGAGGPNLSIDQYYWYDHIHISGR